MTGRSYDETDEALLYERIEAVRMESRSSIEEMATPAPAIMPALR